MQYAAIGIDVVRGVAALQQPGCAFDGTSNKRIDDDVTHERAPLALDTDKPAVEIEDEVVAVAVRERLEHADAELDRRVDDRRFRDRSLLIRRQLHVLRIENGSDDIVVWLENGAVPSVGCPPLPIVEQVPG